MTSRRSRVSAAVERTAGALGDQRQVQTAHDRNNGRCGSHRKSWMNYSRRLVREPFSDNWILVTLSGARHSMDPEGLSAGQGDGVRKFTPIDARPR